MKPGAGKVKGGQFERDVCRILSLWITRGKRNDVFWRSAGSGSSATVASKKGKRGHSQLGDIVSVREEGNWFSDKFIVECKFYRDLQLGRLFTAKGANGFLYKTWVQLFKTALKHERIPLLIVKQNRYPILIITKSEMFNGFPITNVAVQDKAPVTGMTIYELEIALKYTTPKYAASIG